MPFITGNFYLNQSQMQENADYFKLICNELFPEWTLNAICGMLGNAQTESTLNPGIYENLKVADDNGYGFFQWTPGINYRNWCESNNYPYDSMNVVLFRLEYELLNHIQYYKTSQFPLSFRQFLVSNESPEYLANAWCYNYERPEILNQPIRAKRARNWYNYFNGYDPDKPIPPTESKKFWWIYYLKRSY